MGRRVKSFLVDQLGKYRLLKKLGEGLGGIVYLAESDKQVVALKRMRQVDFVLSDAEGLESFKSEFQVLKELTHPHIVRILDFGYDPSIEQYYFTTEYIEGGNIFDATRGMDPVQIEEIFVQALRALSYLHSRHIYHLDIKPPNILVSQSQEGVKISKLIDFGLSGFRKEGVVAGSPAYIAPECFLEKKRDARSDLYALGVTWYECLTGQNPFRKKDVQESLRLQKTFIPSPVTGYSPKIPAYLDPIFSKLLKKNPAERYHRADQVIRDLNMMSGHHYPLETVATALAYLPGEGRLVGRQKEWAQLLDCFEKAFVSRQEPVVCVSLEGGRGMGKSRLLKELKYYAQLHNVSVLEGTETALSDLSEDTLVILDDAKPETIEYIQQWSQNPRRQASLVILAPPSEKEGSFPTGTRIHLGPFDRVAVGEYISSVLGSESAPEFLVNELYARSKGNPLILTEILHSLIASHQIFDDVGRWSSELVNEIGIDFKRLKVPRTLDEYCRNQYQDLSPGAQKLLIAISIARAPLDRGFLVKNTLGITRTDCAVLEESDLIFRDPTTSTFRLNNPSFHDWVNEHLDSSLLAEVNQSLGEYFLTGAGNKEVAWEHLGLGTGTKEERYSYLFHHAEYLLQRMRWLDAARSYEAAYQLAPSLLERVQSSLKQSRALLFAGRHEEAIKIVEKTQSLLKQERENPEQWRWVQQTFADMCNIYLKGGRLDAAREALQVSKILLEEHQEEPVEEMILNNYRASILFREGRVEESAQLFEEMRSQWNLLSFEDKKRVVNNELGSVYLNQGRAAEAKIFFQSDAALYQATADHTRRGLAIYGWAESCCALKQFEEAQKIYEFCADLSRDLKNEELLFHSYAGLGNLAHYRQDWGACIESYQKALDLAQRQLHSDFAYAMAVNLAIAHRHIKDWNSARAYLHYVLDALESEKAHSFRHLSFLAQCSLELGKVYSENQEWIDARDSYREALRLGREHESLSQFRIPAVIGLMKVCVRLDRINECHRLMRDLDNMRLSSEEKEEVERLKGVLSDSSRLNEFVESEIEKTLWETVVIGYKSSL